MYIFDICAGVHVFVCVCLRESVFVCARTCVRVCTCMYVCVCECIYIRNLQRMLRVCVITCMCALCVYKYVGIHLVHSTCTCVVCVSTPVYLFTGVVWGTFADLG